MTFSKVLVVTTLSIIVKGQKFAREAGPLTADEANLDCINKYGASLALVKSASDRTDVFNTCSSGGTTACWLGASDRVNEGEWVWLDGRPFSAADTATWSSNEPNNLSHGQCTSTEDCLQTWDSNTAYNDEPCDCDNASFKGPYICNTNPLDMCRQDTTPANLYYSEETSTLFGPQYCKCLGTYSGDEMKVRITIGARRSTNSGANSDIVYAIGTDDLYFGGILKNDDDGVSLKNRRANLALTPKNGESLITTNSLIGKMLSASLIDPEGNDERNPRRYLTQTGASKFKPLFERVNDAGFGIYDSVTTIDFVITITSNRLTDTTEVQYSKGGSDYTINYQGSFSETDCITVFLDSDTSPLEDGTIDYVTIDDLSNSVVTPDPPQFCNGYSQNAVFLIDESGSVSQTNFQTSVLFVRDLVRDKVATNSLVSTYAFNHYQDFVYSLQQPQSPRQLILDKLVEESNDYNGGGTNIQNALGKARDEIVSINNGLDSVVVLFTDGVGGSPCYSSFGSQVLTDISTYNGVIYTVFIGGYSTSSLSCLDNGQAAPNNNFFIVGNWNNQNFEDLKVTLEPIFCPPAPPAKNNDININELIEEVINKEEDNKKFIKISPKELLSFEVGFIIIISLLIISIVIGVYNCKFNIAKTIKYESVASDVTTDTVQ